MDGNRTNPGDVSCAVGSSSPPIVSIPVIKVAADPGSRFPLASWRSPALSLRLVSERLRNASTMSRFRQFCNGPSSKVGHFLRDSSISTCRYPGQNATNVVVNGGINPCPARPRGGFQSCTAQYRTVRRIELCCLVQDGLIFRITAQDCAVLLPFKKHHVQCHHLGDTAKCCREESLHKTEMHSAETPLRFTSDQ